MKTSKILREAARICEQKTRPGRFGERRRIYGCNAVSIVLGGRERAGSNDADSHLPYVRDKSAQEYIDLFAPENGEESCDGTYGRSYNYGYFGDAQDERCQDHRIVAMCMAAAIARSEGN